MVRILRNPFYSGTIVYRKSFIPDYLEQKAKINKDEVEQIVVEGKHQPIVTKEELQIVQKILESHSVVREEKRGHGCASPIIAEWKLKLMVNMIFDIIWNNKKKIIEIANNIIEKTIQNDSINQFMDEEIMEC